VQQNWFFLPFTDASASSTDPAGNITRCSSVEHYRTQNTEV